jgi:hypothetical protein
MAEHVYHQKLAQRIGNMLVGLGLSCIVLLVIAVDSGHFFNGRLTNYLGSVILVLIMLPLSVFLIIESFSKVIIKTDGLEYHTSMLVLKAKWNNIQNLDYYHQMKSDSSLILAFTDGEVILRPWAKPIKEILRHKAKDIELSASSYKDADGNSLDANIFTYLPAGPPSSLA